MFISLVFISKAKTPEFLTTVANKQCFVSTAMSLYVAQAFLFLLSASLF